MEHNSVKQIIVIRKDLKCRRGKEIAQGCHASLGAILNLMKTDDNGDKRLVLPRGSALERWINATFKKVTVTVDSRQELLDLQKRAEESGLINCLIKDSALTELPEPDYTALAIGPDWSDKIDPITGHLTLY